MRRPAGRPQRPRALHVVRRTRAPRPDNRSAGGRSAWRAVCWIQSSPKHGLCCCTGAQTRGLGQCVSPRTRRSEAPARVLASNSRPSPVALEALGVQILRAAVARRKPAQRLVGLRPWAKPVRHSHSQPFPVGIPSIFTAILSGTGWMIRACRLSFEIDATHILEATQK
eukprot:4304256-Prymnesium_polylepis.1